MEYAHLEPPCPEEEIALAEAAVGYPFPQELKALLRETNGDNWLLLSASRMVETAQLNRKYFTECFDTLEEYEDRIGRFIMFAGNGCGDYYSATASCRTARRILRESIFGSTRPLNTMWWPKTFPT